MTVLTLTVSLPGLRPPPCSETNVEKCKKASTLQLALFYGALYALALGTGGTKPNISTIGADQLDDFDPKEKSHKLSFFNWWAFSAFSGALFAYTVLVYIQDNVGWALGYGLPTLGLAFSIAIFLAGTPFYRHRVPAGSPFTRMAQVIVAAMRNWGVPVPSDPKELYELDPQEYSKKGKFRIDSTPTLRFLNKACVQTGTTSPWKLCSVTQVEETKQMLRMIRILIATFIPSCMVAQIFTLFVKQGATLDRSIGSFKMPPASLTGFVIIWMLVSVVLYDRFFVRILQKWPKNPRGISLLHRMGIGLVLHVVIMIVASFTERWRLRVAREHNVVESGGQIPLAIFILLPQFVLMGTAEAFVEVAKIEFFYDQAPESMKSLGTSYSMITQGVGNFISSFLLSTVSDITKRHGHHGWILNNLNASHLDYYFAFFVVLNVLNFAFFLFVAKLYVYRAEVSDSMVVLKEELKALGKVHNQHFLVPVIQPCDGTRPTTTISGQGQSLAGDGGIWFMVTTRCRPLPLSAKVEAQSAMAGFGLRSPGDTDPCHHRPRSKLKKRWGGLARAHSLHEAKPHPNLNGLAQARSPCWVPIGC
ncbi:Cyanate hydratase (Cyanase) [Psidium guajava]|nr:Cyanate hydratase (Cyanase) [Psidium guajava]